MSVSILRVKLDGRATFLDGSIEFALRAKCDAQADVGHYIFRIKFDGRAILLDGSV